MGAMIRGIGRVMRREVRRYGERGLYRTMLVLWCCSLLFFLWFFRAGVARELPVAWVDNDCTATSRQLERMVCATPAVGQVFGAASADEGQRLLREGRVMAVVVIPDGFERDLLAGRQGRAEGYVSGTNITANGLISTSLQQAVMTLSARFAAARCVAAGVPASELAATVMPIRLSLHALSDPWINYGYYLLPGFLPMMLLIFTMMASVYSFGSELREGTACAWLRTACGSVAAAACGKIVPLTAVATAAGGVMLAGMFGGFGVPMNGSWGVLAAATLLLVLAYQSIGMLLVALFANMRLALSLGGGYSVLAFSFSGLTFPLLAMSGAMRAASRIFPYTYYMEVMINEALRGAPLRSSLTAIGALALFALVPFLFLPRLGRVARMNRYYGRQ